MQVRQWERPVQQSLFDGLDSAEYSSQLKRYRASFARDPHGPYAIQRPGKTWKTKYKALSDPLIKAHLEKKYWVAAKASWYPNFYFIDFDAPASGDVERVLETLNLKSGQYYQMTSPSYEKDGSCHLVLYLEYKGKRPTHRLGYEALRNMVGSVCEVYPQLRRKFRLPLGRDQFLISENGKILNGLSWQESLYWLDKLDPVAIEGMIFQQPLPFPSEAKKEDHPRIWLKTEQVRELYEHGLQAPGTRHKSQWVIAVYLWRANWLPQDAIAKISRWMRKKHNGFSETINRGNFRAVEGEIFRQVQWIWTHFRPYPDTPHNLDGYVTKRDLRWIAEVYPCDVVNQKRLFALVSYMRPRAHHDFVYVPAHVWREEIANIRTYHDFLHDLEKKGLLQSVMSYRHVEEAPGLSYSRKFRLALPSIYEEPLQYDERNEQNYYQALKLAYNSIREITDLTGVRTDVLYGIYKKIASEIRENTYI